MPLRADCSIFFKVGYDCGKMLYVFSSPARTFRYVVTTTLNSLTLLSSSGKAALNANILYFIVKVKQGGPGLGIDLQVVQITPIPSQMGHIVINIEVFNFADKYVARIRHAFCYIVTVLENFWQAAMNKRAI
jgi:hypothetical protein